MISEIIHFATDEKFINSGFGQFESVAPGRNRLLIYNVTGEKLKHIKIDVEKREFIKLSKEVFENLPLNSLIILHSLPYHILEFIKYAPKSSVIIWCVFGFEIYGDPSFYSSKKALDRITRNRYKQKVSILKKLKTRTKSIIFNFLRKHRNWLPLNKSLLKKLNTETKKEKLERVDYFALPYIEEYEAEQRIIKIKRPFLRFSYYPLERILDVGSAINIEKDIMLIGHSGFKNGNHLDIVHKIKNIIPDELEVVLPLSYGNEKYINDIIPIIKDEIPNANILNDFIELKEYNKLLNRVKIAVFNNRRQQGMGNIVGLLYMGAKVFISNRNSLYKFFKNNNILIFSYETDIKNKDSFLNGLTVEEIEQNRDNLKKVLSEKELLNELSISLKKIEALNK